MFCGKTTGGRFTSAGWTEGPQPRDFSGLAVCAVLDYWSMGDFCLETPCGFLVPLLQSWTDTGRMRRANHFVGQPGLGAVRDQIGCLRGRAKRCWAQLVHASDRLRSGAQKFCRPYTHQ
jgi:hypothetical protein